LTSTYTGVITRARIAGWAGDLSKQSARVILSIALGMADQAIFGGLSTKGLIL
jgi:hypothetical protein